MNQPEEKLFSLAAEKRAVAELQLITMAKARGATWAVIGATLGMDGKTAKRRAKALERQARRQGAQEES